MLKVGQPSKISFNVNVMGTQAEPTVRVVISTSPEISFQAKKDGSAWVADVEVPRSVDSGTYKLRVEVLLNNRLFTPIVKSIDIQADEIDTQEISYQQPATIAQEVKPVEVKPLLTQFEAENPPKAKVDLTVQRPLSALSKTAIFDSVSKIIPRPKKIESKIQKSQPQPISLKDIDNEIKDEAQFEEKAQVHQPIKRAQLISIIKEHIVYE